MPGCLFFYCLLALDIFRINAELGHQRVGVGFLGRSDVEEAVELEAENVPVGGSGKGSGCRVSEKGIVRIEPILFVFDQLFAAEVIDGRSEDIFLHRFGRIVSELAIGILPEKGKSLLNSGDEA